LTGFGKKLLGKKDYFRQRVLRQSGFRQKWMFSAKIISAKTMLFGKRTLGELFSADLLFGETNFDKNKFRQRNRFFPDDSSRQKRIPTKLILLGKKDFGRNAFQQNVFRQKWF